MNIQDKLELTELIARYNNRSIKFAEYHKLMKLLLVEHDHNLGIESTLKQVQNNLDFIVDLKDSYLNEINDLQAQLSIYENGIPDIREDLD